MNKDELNTVLLNNLESLNRKLDQLIDVVKKNTDAVNNSGTSSRELKESVIESNRVFDQLYQSVKEIYNKVQQIEMVAKLAKQFGPMFGGFGGTSQPPKK